MEVTWSFTTIVCVAARSATAVRGTQLIRRVQDRQSSVVGADDAFDVQLGPEVDAGDASAGEEDGGDPAGVVEQVDLEGRVVAPRSDAEGADPPADDDARPWLDIGDR
jgi:hypothetical protein